MLFDALALPRNVVIGIFKFVDDRSLIRAREVHLHEYNLFSECYNLGVQTS